MFSGAQKLMKLWVHAREILLAVVAVCNTKSCRLGRYKHSRQKNKNQDFQNTQMSRNHDKISAVKKWKENGANAKLLALLLPKKFHRLEFSIDFGPSQFRSCKFVIILIIFQLFTRSNNQFRNHEFECSQYFGPVIELSKIFVIKYSGFIVSELIRWER